MVAKEKNNPKDANLGKSKTSEKSLEKEGEEEDSTAMDVENRDASETPRENPTQETTQRWSDSATPGTFESTPESQRIPCAQPRTSEDVPTTTDAIPKVLGRLMEEGLSFRRVPVERWQISGWSATLNKNRSLSFTIDVPCSTQDILDGFTEASIDVSTIHAIQRRVSNHTWEVTFASPEARSLALGVARVTILGNEVRLGTTEKHQSVIVKIFEAPVEMPDTVIIGRLSCYGKVQSFRRERTGDILNGVRSARMLLKGKLPSSIHIAGELIRLWHPGQPRACYRCGSEDHIGRECRSARCWNCQESGHRSNDCLKKPLCNICLKEDHPLSKCPFLVYSADVADVRAGETSYAQAASATGGEGGASAPPAPRNTSRNKVAENNARRQKEKEEKRRQQQQQELEELRAWKELEEEKARKAQAERRERAKRREERLRTSGESSDDGEHVRKRSGRERARNDPRRGSHEHPVRDRSSRPVRYDSGDSDGWEYVSYRRKR